MQVVVATRRPARYQQVLLFAWRTVCLLGLGLGWAGMANAQLLGSSPPEHAGVSSSDLIKLITRLDQEAEQMHSIVLVRHNFTILNKQWEPYHSRISQELYSLSKSYTSTAVGFAVAEGKLSLDDPVLKFFPEDSPSEPSEFLKKMRVRDLLTMSTGHQTEPPVREREASWTHTFLHHPVEHEPGTHFLYNTPATYMLSAIVQKVTDQTTLDYLRPRLFTPLRVNSPTWGTSPQGVTLGGYGLYASTEEIATFGRFYLHQGKIGPHQVLPAEWIQMATSKQVENGSNPDSDWNQGYGFQFWRCRHNCFRGDGAFGQYCIVFPDQDAVLAIHSGVKDMQGVLNIVWEELLPAFKPEALPVNDAAYKQLQELSLQVRIPQSPANPVKPPLITALYQLEANSTGFDELKIESAELFGDLHLLLGGKETPQRLSFGGFSWVRGEFSLPGHPTQPLRTVDSSAAAERLPTTYGRGVWQSPSTYAGKLCFVGTPFQTDVTLQLGEGTAELTLTPFVGFGDTKPIKLVGKKIK